MFMFSCVVLIVALHVIGYGILVWLLFGPLPTNGAKSKLKSNHVRDENGLPPDHGFRRRTHRRLAHVFLLTAAILELALVVFFGHRLRLEHVVEEVQRQPPVQMGNPKGLNDAHE